MAWSNRLSYALPTHLPTVTRLLLALARPLIQSLPNLGAWGLPGRLLLLAAGCGTGFAAVDWLALLTQQELGEMVVPLLQGAVRRGSEGFMQDMLLTCRPWAVDIGQVACPVLVVRGGEDVNVTAAMVAWFKRQFEAGAAKAVRVLEVPGEGHLSLMACRGREVLRAVVHLLPRQPSLLQCPML
jgi:pimeloyl-ACP methyl ester carboxylesterase